MRDREEINLIPMVLCGDFIGRGLLYKYMCTAL
jgi:hypothetical protein